LKLKDNYLAAAFVTALPVNAEREASSQLWQPLRHPTESWVQPPNMSVLEIKARSTDSGFAQCAEQTSFIRRKVKTTTLPLLSVRSPTRVFLRLRIPSTTVVAILGFSFRRE
jgi:hypothetical protein